MTTDMYGLATILIFCLEYVVCDAEAAQYCMRDHFNPQCLEDEVIIITSAMYGRMRLGKCIQVDLGFLGCKTDVMPIIASACSGKRECSFPVLSEELEETKPCIDGVQPYLEADYRCQKVTFHLEDGCHFSRNLKGSGTISSSVSRQLTCGIEDSPWTFQFSSGKQVTISIIDFEDKSAVKHGRTKCRKVGYIQEDGHMDKSSICRPMQKESDVYTSNGRSVSIVIESDLGAPEFLLKYKVFGCPDIKVQRNTWYKREGDKATIGCEGHDATWRLHCENSKWVGVVGNCSDTVTPDTDATDLSELLPFSNGYMMWIIIIVCLGVLIVCVFGAVIVALKCRKRNHPVASRSLRANEDNKNNPLLDDDNHYRGLIRPHPGHVAPPGYSQSQLNPMPSNMIAFHQTLPRVTDGANLTYKGQTDRSGPKFATMQSDASGRSQPANYFVLDQDYMNMKEQNKI